MPILRQFIRSLFGLAGLDVRRKSATPGVPDVYARRGQTLVRFMLQRGVNVLVDVGANEGQYAAGMRALGFKGQMISFEPLDAAFPALRNRCANDGDWRCDQLAIGDSNAEAVIKVAGNLESSSILPMMDVHVDAHPPSKYVAEQKVNVTRLDSILPGILKGGEKDRLMLKLDVQGYELKALRGADGIFDQVELVDIEVSLLPLYEGQPSLVELIDFFESRGFIPVSFENGFTDPRNGHALQVDAVFMRGGDREAMA